MLFLHIITTIAIMKSKPIILSLLVLLVSCEREVINPLDYAETTSTKVHINHSTHIGEFEEAYPEYEKELIKFADGFEFKKVLGIPDTYILDGDVLINEKGIYELIKKNAETRSAVHRNPFKYWVNREVRYKFDDAASSDFISRVENAINDIESNCGVRFQLTTSTSGDYIVFVQSTSAVGNNSWVGCQGGCQVVNIHDYTYHGIILHETLHALGFFHEHSRQDRDNYITINWDNIRNNMRYAFNKYTVTYGEGYDISSIDEDSVMMYSSYISDPSFVFDPSVPVMYWVADPSHSFGGQRSYLSDGDIKGLVSVYGPPYTFVDKTITPIQHSTQTINDHSYVTEIDSVNVFLRFYKYVWHVVPQRILYPRSVVLIKTTVTAGSDGILHRSTFTQNVYVNAGDSTHFVNKYERRNCKVDGQLIDYYDIEYSVR